MDVTGKSRMLGLLCVLVALTSAFATYPVAEIGMVDDFSYIRSAQVLADTGRVVYNGWATAMLGWQLYLGAIFVKLFGHSFTAVRASTLFLGLVTTFLWHRTMVRAGINSRNATIGSLALILSPIYLPLVLSFMSDIGGLFTIILCLYSCLRALQSRRDSSMLGWIAFAGFSNAIGGTVRQISWLGVLVMVPCTVWLLRRRPHAVLVGAFVFVMSVAFIFGSLHWFHNQPYSIPESFFPGELTTSHMNHMVGQFLRGMPCLAMLLLPILLVFVSAVPFRNRAAVIISGVSTLICFLVGVFLNHENKLVTCLAPFNVFGSYITEYGVYDAMSLRGENAQILSFGFRVLLTICVIIAFVRFAVFVFVSRHRPKSAMVAGEIPWRSLQVVIIPFAVAYLGLLLSRAAFAWIFDRYFLPLLAIGILILVRLFQERVRHAIPSAGLGCIFLFGAYTIASTHDTFSQYRAMAIAIEELTSAGVNPDSIDGGFEYDGMLQIDRFGHLNDRRIRVPANTYSTNFRSIEEPCHPKLTELTPVIVPGYTLSLDPTECGGLAGFAAVPYHTWLGSEKQSVYIVKTINPARLKPQ